MNRYWPYRLSAVPRPLHTQLEIAKAIRTLVGPDEDELLRQRRDEIAAIRRDLDVLVRDVRNLGEELPALVMAELQSELRKYSADQPRVPAGNPDGRRELEREITEAKRAAGDLVRRISSLERRISAQADESPTGGASAAGSDLY